MASTDLQIAALLLGVFGLAEVFSAHDITQWPRRLCMALLSATTASAASTLLVDAAVRAQAPLPLYRALLVVQSIIGMLPILLLFAYALYCCGEDYRKSVTLRVLFVSAAVLTAVSCP